MPFILAKILFYTSIFVGFLYKITAKSFLNLYSLHQTNMKRTILLVIIFTLFVSICPAQDKNQKVHPDDEFYHEMFTIRGKVEILNYPVLGKIKGDNHSILFQRVGCKKCIFEVLSDEEGNYEIGVIRGKYRIIMREVRGGLEPSFDLLAPLQPRIIDATKGKRTIEFNIQLMLPNN